MVARDGRSEWLRAENASLHAEIVRRDDHIRSLEADLERTRTQHSRLQKSGSNIIQIDEIRRP